MPAFDGAKHFARLAVLFALAAVIAMPYAGCSGWIGVLLALYLLLSFFNRLEERDFSQKYSSPRRSKKSQ